jgi:hypothetical protein
MNKCKIANCKNRPYYKIQGKKLVYCNIHKKENVNYKSLKNKELEKFINLGYWPLN